MLIKSVWSSYLLRSSGKGLVTKHYVPFPHACPVMWYLHNWNWNTHCKPIFPARGMLILDVELWMYIYSGAGRELFTSVISRVFAVDSFDGWSAGGMFLRLFSTKCNAVMNAHWIRGWSYNPFGLVVSGKFHVLLHQYQFCTMSKQQCLLACLPFV